MAQVAILVNGSPDPRRSELASTLAAVLGCPVLTPLRVQETLVAQTGPVAPRDALDVLAGETIWRTAGLVEAGVVVDGSWSAAHAAAVEAGLALAGSPRVVEVWCGGPGEPLGITPLVRVDTSTDVDLDALVVEISALFV